MGREDDTTERGGRVGSGRPDRSEGVCGWIIRWHALISGSQSTRSVRRAAKNMPLEAPFSYTPSTLHGPFTSTSTATSILPRSATRPATDPPRRRCSSMLHIISIRRCLALHLVSSPLVSYHQLRIVFPVPSYQFPLLLASCRRIETAYHTHFLT